MFFEQLGPQFIDLGALIVPYDRWKKMRKYEANRNKKKKKNVSYVGNKVLWFNAK